jgi:hypothetical protein
MLPPSALNDPTASRPAKPVASVATTICGSGAREKLTEEAMKHRADASAWSLAA